MYGFRLRNIRPILAPDIFINFRVNLFTLIYFIQTFQEIKRIKNVLENIVKTFNLYWNYCFVTFLLPLYSTKGSKWMFFFLFHENNGRSNHFDGLPTIKGFIYSSKLFSLKIPSDFIQIFWFFHYFSWIFQQKICSSFFINFT